MSVAGDAVQQPAGRVPVRVWLWTLAGSLAIHLATVTVLAYLHRDPVPRSRPLAVQIVPVDPAPAPASAGAEGRQAPEAARWADAARRAEAARQAAERARQAQERAAETAFARAREAARIEEARRMEEARRAEDARRLAAEAAGQAELARQAEAARLAAEAEASARARADQAARDAAAREAAARTAAARTAAEYEAQARSGGPDPGIPTGRRPGSGSVASGGEGAHAGHVARIVPGGAATGAAGPPRVLARVEPRYPATAYRLAVAGVTHLRVSIRPDGTVAAVDVVRSAGHPDLDRAAVEAIRRWRFEPAASDAPGAVRQVEVPVRFDLVD